MFKKIIEPILMPHWTMDIILCIPRLVYGFLLTADFGSAKFGMPWSPVENNLSLFEIAFWFPNDVSHFGGIFSLFPSFFAWMAGFSEAVGGLFLLLGLQTRISSLLIACTMLVAMICQQWQAGLWNMLPAMGILWVCLNHIVLGCGRFGLDYVITNFITLTSKK